MATDKNLPESFLAAFEELNMSIPASRVLLSVATTKRLTNRH